MKGCCATYGFDEQQIAGPKRFAKLGGAHCETLHALLEAPYQGVGYLPGWRPTTRLMIFTA